MKKKTIVLGITASIAAYKACDLVSALKKKGYDVICIMTSHAKHFVTSLTLETLSGNKVYDDMFTLPEKRETVHISLAELADLVVIFPATANIIGKLASGISDDLLTCTVISTKSPVLIAPAMNTNMYKHKITEKNINELKKIGYKFIGPEKGHLACGCVGVGHIKDTRETVERIEKILK